MRFERRSVSTLVRSLEPPLLSGTNSTLTLADGGPDLTDVSDFFADELRNLKGNEKGSDSEALIEMGNESGKKESEGENSQEKKEGEEGSMDVVEEKGVMVTNEEGEGDMEEMGGKEENGGEGEKENGVGVKVELAKGDAEISEKENQIHTPVQKKSVRKHTEPAVYPPIHSLSHHRIGLESLPEQSMAHFKRQGVSLTLMLAGRSGCGKSTFLNSLFAANLVSSQHSTKTLEVRRFELEEDGFRLALTTIDTPGFADRVDNSAAWQPLCRFIDHQYTAHLFQSEQPHRQEMRDTRVHCCLYFVEPNVAPLRPVDIMAMKELSRRVNLIPVVSKGDTLCEFEAKKMREIVRRTLEYHGIEVCQLVLDPVFQSIRERIPFVVGGCIQKEEEEEENEKDQNEKDKKDGKGNGINHRKGNGMNYGKEYAMDHGKDQGLSENGLSPCRTYPWGSFQLENAEHCDFAQLRQILLQEHALDLISSTEAHYDVFRQQCLARRLQESGGSVGDDGDGLEEYMQYTQTTLAEYRQATMTEDPAYEAAKRRVARKFEVEVAFQEQRFREWKNALIEKQKELNRSIEEQHEVFVRLQKA